MPIFGRRQLQHTFDDLGPWFSEFKAKDLLNRLENVDPDQALPAEYELALTWGVSRTASLEIDRRIGGRTPDIYSADFLLGGPIVADVAAISDDALSDESVMMRARNIINNKCNGILKGAGNHLHYTFREESGYSPADRHSKGRKRYFRRRRITEEFNMDSALETALSKWLSGGPPHQALQWQGEHIDVVIVWQGSVHPQSSVFCTMPSEAHDLKDNPLYRVLKTKQRQLKGAPEGVRRVILLGDAGCSLLRNIRPIGPMFDTVSGQQVIQSFFADPVNTIDFVIVFTPKHLHESSYVSSNNPRIWQFDVFYRCSQLPEAEFDRFRALAEALPSPYLDGYQARSWHQQGMFDPKGRGHYLPLEWSEGPRHATMRLSARALQELIAGRLSKEEFELCTTGKPNLFALQLAQGRTISSVRFEPKGTNEDDDYVVFEFSDDPAAAKLRLPGSPKPPPA
jgi:hypothetical protein